MQLKKVSLCTSRIKTVFRVLFRVLILLTIEIGVYPLCAHGFMIDEAVSTHVSNPSIDLWSQFSYFDQTFDLFNFQEKASSTSKLDYERIWKGGINWPFSEHFILRSAFTHHEGSVRRISAPTELEDDRDAISLGFQYALSDTAALEFTLHRAVFGKKTITTYQFGQTVLGEDIVLRDPSNGEPIPLLELGMQTSSAAVSFTKKNNTFSFDYDVFFRYRYADIDPLVSSVLFGISDSTLLNATVNGRSVGDTLNALRNTLPQATNWQEHIFSTGFLVTVPFNQSWQTLWGLSAYWLRRVHYEKGDNEKPINTNLQFDGYVLRSLTSNSVVYVHGQLFRHYLAGVNPGFYNRRVAHLFDNPYGTFSIGIAYNF